MSGNPADILGVTPEPKDAQQGHHGQRDNECTESWTSPCYFGNHGDDQAGEQAFDNEVQHVCPPAYFVKGCAGDWSSGILAAWNPIAQPSDSDVREAKLARDHRSPCLCAAHKLKTRYGEMQSPLETPVQALRNTRPVEEVCAWTEFFTWSPQIDQCRTIRHLRW